MQNDHPASEINGTLEHNGTLQVDDKRRDSPGLRGQCDGLQTHLAGNASAGAAQPTAGPQVVPADEPKRDLSNERGEPRVNGASSPALHRHSSPARDRSHHHQHGSSRNDHHHHHKHKHRSRSRSRTRSRSRSRSRSKNKKHSRSRSRDRRHHSHSHHHRRSRSRSGERRHHRHHKQQHQNDNKSHHHRRSRSKSREHHRRRSRSRSLSGTRNRRVELTPPARYDRSASPPLPRASSAVQPPTNGEAAPAVAALAGTSTPNHRVIHESTLVSLRSSASPRSHPLPIPEGASVETPLPPSPAAPPLPPRRLQLSGITFGSAQARGMRPYMEDRHVMLEHFVPLNSNSTPAADGVTRSFAAVYDGHNGTLAAEHAEARLHGILATEPALRTCIGDGPPAVVAQEENRVAVALVRSFETTDREILIRCRQEGGRSGATGVVVMHIGETLYAAHCGDSRAVMCRSGEPLRLTEDHKPNLPRERQRVEALGGRVDFARCWRVIVDPGDGRPASGLAVSRSFGDPDFKEPLHLVTATPDVMRERLAPEDSFIVLASDGLWDVMTDKEACDVVNARLNASGIILGGEQGAAEYINNKDPRKRYNAAATMAAEALVKASLEAGTMDNVTAVVGLLHWT